MLFTNISEMYDDDIEFVKSRESTIVNFCKVAEIIIVEETCSAP